MKRLLLAFFSLIILVCCSPTDKNIPIIKKEFKAFVRKTFDDPKALQEIVEITPRDTVSLSKIKALAELTDSTINLNRDMRHMKDSVQNVKMEGFYNDLMKSRNISYSDALTGRMFLAELMSTTQKEIDAKTKVANLQIKLNQLCDSLVYRPAIYSYEIKYRKQYPDGLKLETAYAYIDSLSGFKAILPKPSDSEIICTDYYDVFEQSKKCMIAVGELNAIVDQYDEQFEEFEKFVMRIK